MNSDNTNTLCAHCSRFNPTSDGEGRCASYGVVMHGCWQKCGRFVPRNGYMRDQGKKKNRINEKTLD